MSHGHSRGTGSTGSRSGVSPMPPIDENEATPPLPSPPQMPLRVPQKSPRRLMRDNGIEDRNHARSNRGLPPPYTGSGNSSPPTPTLHPPPSYKEAHGKFVEQESLGSEPEGDSETKVFGVSRRRGCCLLVIALVVIAVIALGLGVGLTIGLRDRNTNPHPELASSPDSDFPAGSFAFKANLQNTSTDCTSNPSTWRCFPFTEGSSATFFWIITYVNTQYYKVSSTDNPFAPSFTNLSLELLGDETDDERLRFSFSMDKTVVPDDKLSSSNRAARCTFKDTVFEATMWTRRNGSHDDGSGSGNGKFALWPGDVEIVQRKESESGSPECVNVDGDEIASVKSGSGTCECRYTNFDTD
ncbi:hypothetical protein FZEAL_2931 [Fusarium zealandicum]|uniref:Tat pathway signal sequence n=1 Tax=Fusarium zealandicum TaxID=1053134 RepID=A0A8H4XMB5_9HYPO|nr:hypothetical protein FZEAL_2931 [Fusarium zealandicum]